MLKFSKIALIGLGTLGFLGLMSSPTRAVELASYQAGYQARLSDARDQAAVSAVSGQIAFGFEQSCEGLIFQQSGALNWHFANGNMASQVLNFSSLEQKQTYQFTVKTEGMTQGVILGRAEMPSSGGAGEAQFARPKAKAFPLPAGTLFPAAHTRLMIESALAGKTQFQSHIFEGTDVEGAKLLVVFISPMSEAGKMIQKNLGGDFANHQGWNFRMAYFDPKSQTSAPQYEIDVDQLDNGIALRWVLDYTSHAVEMKMVKVEQIKNPDCSQK